MTTNPEKARTDIAAVQFARLTDRRKVELATEIFSALEYDADGNPGGEWDGGDTLQTLGDLFVTYGVTFTRPGNVPAGYRFNRHHAASGDLCDWSTWPIPEPNQRIDRRGDIHCPYGCPDSIVEADPDARRD